MGWRRRGAEGVAGECSVGCSQLDCGARLYCAAQEAETVQNLCPWAPRRNAAQQRHRFLMGVFLLRRSRDGGDGRPGLSMYTTVLQRSHPSDQNGPMRNDSLARTMGLIYQFLNRISCVHVFVDEKNLA